MKEPNYDAAKMLRVATKHLNMHLSTLVAETALWAHPEVHKRLLTISGSAAFFPDRRRARTGRGEKRGQRIGNVRLDDNTYANNAIKRAIGVSRSNLLGFEACHIWSDTCYDERYHTAIANLVLLPRALAALSDYDEEVCSALRFRSYDLYGWHPENKPKPIRPESYPKNWRDPLPYSHEVERTVTIQLQQMGFLPHVKHSIRDKILGEMHQSSARIHFDVTSGGVTTKNLPKRKAILAVVRGLVSAGVSPTEIQSVLHWRGKSLFRHEAGRLSGSELVQAISLEAKSRGKTFDPRRFFCADSDLIYADGKTYAFSNQWGEDTELAIDALLKVFPNCNVTCRPAQQA